MQELLAHFESWLIIDSLNKMEELRNAHRGVGPWATRRAGWRQAQRRKWARRVGR